MMSLCDQILDRTATGEALTEEQEAHAVRCVDCARLAGVTRLLATAAEDPEPQAGFSARMQVAARGRLAARRRNRIALTSAAAAGLAAAVALFVTRPADPMIGDPGAMRALAEQEPSPRPPPVAERGAEAADRVAADLVRVADVDHSLEGEAAWDEITDSLTPYRVLLETKGAQGDHR